MNSFIPIFSAFFILLGFLVWRFPKLIAGYNTMTSEQQKKVDVKGLKAFMCRVFCAIGVLVFVSTCSCGCSWTKRRPSTSVPQ